MDFALTEEQEMIRDAAREFAQKEIAPVAATFDESGGFPEDTIRMAGREQADLAGEREVEVGDVAVPTAARRIRHDRAGGRRLQRMTAVEGAQPRITFLRRRPPIAARATLRLRPVPCTGHGPPLPVLRVRGSHGFYVPESAVSIRALTNARTRLASNAP